MGQASDPLQFRCYLTLKAFLTAVVNSDGADRLLQPGLSRAVWDLSFNGVQTRFLAPDEEAPPFRSSPIETQALQTQL
jgi:hypothetical protein